jgi:hypothetical protein
VLVCLIEFRRLVRWLMVVPCHNDSTFLYTDPPSAVGAWIALEDCTPANGCLVSEYYNTVNPLMISPSYLDHTNSLGYLVDS